MARNQGQEEAHQFEPDLTLRQVLESSSFHMAIGPAFFGFFAYFGALEALWDNELLAMASSANGKDNIGLLSMAGASAGAMVALATSAGVTPAAARDFLTHNVTSVSQFADFPGALAVFRGRLFEQLMTDFITSSPKQISRIEDSLIPVAVTGYCIHKFRGVTINEGSIARAARASATFPFLFQPVGVKLDGVQFTLIDGGISDPAGWVGTSQFIEGGSNVVTVVVLQTGAGRPPGPDYFLKMLEVQYDRLPHAKTLPEKVRIVSVQLIGLPFVSPWTFSQGVVAMSSAQSAMEAALDLPLQKIPSMEAHHEHLLLPVKTTQLQLQENEL